MGGRRNGNDWREVIGCEEGLWVKRSERREGSDEVKK